MSEPLALLPLAVASGAGRIDHYDAGQLVAAGLTLLQRCAPLVRAMAGRRAAILLPTGPQFLTAMAACDGRGAVLVNPLAAPPEIAWQFQDAGVGAVFTNRLLSSRLPSQAMSGVPLVLLDEAPRRATVAIDGRSIEVDLGSHRGLPIEGAADASGRDEECAIVYTSAMGGRSRGAILTHRNLIANGRSTVAAAALTRADKALAILPFSHLFGLTVSGVAPLFAGGVVLTMERFHPIKALDTIEREGASLLVGVPAVFAAMVQAIERRGTPFTSHALRVCICGGAVLPASVQERFANLTGVELRQGYGLTEAAPVTLFNRVSLPNVRGTLGVSFPGVETTIRTPDGGGEVARGVEGEICIRGENVFAGYVNGATDGLRIRGGWLYSGDRGVEHADGTIGFRGLYKRMFTRNGFNIYPTELEQVIASMPGVRSARVWAIPDDARENDIGVEVAGDVSEADVKSWCDGRLSAYKQPSVITVRTEVAE
ncbi:MAG TPA: AMP-binding protein [Gemmatimonas sp.]|nr:AMP-binding protein [Gemmatimonas sp.]